jgi:hypothetical protein
MGKSATVVWIATQPELFGYDLHTNLKPPVEFPKGTIDSFLHDYNFTGAIHECPYDDISQMFDVNAIVQSLLPNAPQQEVPAPAPQAETPPSDQKRAEAKRNRKKKR